MPDSKYVQLLIEGASFDLPVNEQIPVSISYEMEDEEDFSKKKAATSFNINVPATLQNSQWLNSFFRPESEDFTPDGFFSRIWNTVLKANGNELLVGKGFMVSASHTNKPEEFTLNIYGNNGDWAIQNSELTLYDVLSSNTHVLNESTIIASWNADGNSEDNDYVYAPVRYRNAFSDGDTNVKVLDLCPSLFIYWLLYRGFKKAGYQIVSNFMDSNYFRRLVMPWTWGSFLFINSKQLDVLKFSARSTGTQNWSEGAGSSFSINQLAEASNGYIINNDYTCGGFDNGGVYSTYNGVAVFTYPNTLFTQFGSLIFGLSYTVAMKLDCDNNSNLSVRVEWYVNGALSYTDTIKSISAAALASATFFGKATSYFETPAMNAGDVVEAKIRITGFKSLVGSASYQIYGAICNPDYECEFRYQYVKIPEGGIVDFKKYERFKDYKWLDLLRGCVDAFNLQFATDPISKKVYIEPEHPYSLNYNLTQDIQPGFNDGNRLDWRDKQDLLQKSTVEIFSDFEQVFKISMADDPQDGLLKLLQDRHSVNLSQAIYQFPERFKKGIKEKRNRFFSPVVHYSPQQWKHLSSSGATVQMIALVPENVSNTSNPEAENTFSPKLAWYKGLQDRNTYGFWQFNNKTIYDYPLLFAVNYRNEDDPVLTYNDQLIGETGSGIVAPGLFRRFFQQRFAIMRHGKKYSTWMRLNNTDVMNFLHREYIIIGQSVYQLIGIDNYKPLSDDSTGVRLWRWYPVTAIDAANTFPSHDSVNSNTPIANTPDTKYYPTIALLSDIPNR